MKSLAKYLQGLYAAVFSQIAEKCPRLHRDCERDSSRLLSLVERRGIPFLMVDLPRAGKHFDLCLAAGQLTPFGEAGQRPFRRGGVIPRLFKGLLLSVFDEDGLLRIDPDIQAISFLRQLYYGAKKVEVACEDSKTWEQINEFFRIEREVKSGTLLWDQDDFSAGDASHLDLRDDVAPSGYPYRQRDLFDRSGGLDPLSTSGLRGLEAAQRVADIVASSLGGFDPLAWRARHGPGAVSDQHHTQFKYDFPNWPDKLSRVFPLAEFGFANYGHWVDELDSGRCNDISCHEPPSRLIAVPKTLSGPRLIASEPVSHQWCQQTIKDFLTVSLLRTPIWNSIHFRDQSFNQRLAKEASHTQSHVTVDLSSASDRLSCWVVERVFRRNPSLLDALHATRTRWVVNTIDRKSPRFHKLRKFACMGSACTFPVQSYVFACLAIGSVLSSRRLPYTIQAVRRASQEVLVFGDDIIVPDCAWETLQELLGHLGLEVNRKKTFFTGKFRESCGVDAYDGHDVTPTYLATDPDVSRPGSIMSSVDIANNFSLRGWWRVSDYIESTVRRIRQVRLPRVPMGSGVLGWYDPFGFDTTGLKRRWNPNLQRIEFLMTTASAGSSRTPVERGSMLLQYFTEVFRPPLRSEERLGLPSRPKSRLRLRWEALGFSEDALSLR